MLNLDARTPKDPQVTELAGLMNVKDFSKTIVLEATVYPYLCPYMCWSRQDSSGRSLTRLRRLFRAFYTFKVNKLI
jgi:hypothetical protein